MGNPLLGCSVEAGGDQAGGAAGLRESSQGKKLGLEDSMTSDDTIALHHEHT